MFRNWSLRIKIILTAVLVSFIPFLLSTVLLTRHLYESFQEQVSAFSYYSMQVLGQGLEQMIEAANKVSQYVIISPQIKRYLQADKAAMPAADYSQCEGDALMALGFLPFTADAIRYLAVQSFDGRMISTGPGYYIATADEIEQDVAADGRAIWGLERQNRTRYVTLHRLLRNPQRVSNHLGVMKLYMDEALFRDRLRPLPTLPTVENYLAGPDGAVLVAPEAIGAPLTRIDPELLSRAAASVQQCTLDGRRYFLSAYPIRLNGWFAVSLLPYSYVNHYLSGFGIILAAAFLGFFAASALLAWIFSRIIVSPIREICGLMASVADEDFSVRTSVRGKNEIALLQERFNAMSERLEKLHRETYVYNLRLRDARIKELQSKINPHFLYNTLDSIYWMSELHGLHDTSEMVASLSKLLKISLTVDADGFVPFRTECLHVNCYIAIQRIRFRDTIRFEIEHEAGNEDCRVLALLLQPLVENAIAHGLEPQGGGLIRIASRRAGADLLCEVYDSGAGMDEAYFRQITGGAERHADAKGLALRNINDRLTLKFGPAYALRYARPAAGGSIFTVLQPYKEGYDDQAADR